MLCFSHMLYVIFLCHIFSYYLFIYISSYFIVSLCWLFHHEGQHLYSSNLAELSLKRT